MTKTFEDYGNFKIETVKPPAVPKRRRFKLSLLLLLVLGWAMLLHTMEKAGSFSTFINVQLERLK